MKLFYFVFIFFLLCLFILHNLDIVICGSHERRLLNDLLSNYNVLERPVANESEVLIVYFSLTLQQIIDVDEKNQNIITNMWLRLEWNDSNLRWSPNDYGGITDLRISPDKVWRPDILIYNSADEKFDGTYHSNVVVNHNGSCLYIPPGIFKSTCKIDITWFPFDDQYCDIKFGSWTYYGSAVDLKFINDSTSGDISPYIPNGEWVLLGVPGIRNVQSYECCPEQYIDITYTIGIRRRTLYYGFNLIVPSVIISSMTLLSFTLPPDSGEKLTLGVTILLSMIVFMMQLAEIMPATSDSVSIVGSYFACIMVMVAFSVVMTVVVLNFHHRTTEQQQEMPYWIRKVIVTWLPLILRIKKPPELLRCEQQRKQNKSTGNLHTQYQAYCATNNPYQNQNHVPSDTWNNPCTTINNLNSTWIANRFNTPSSPTHLELIRLTEKMKEYESLCHKRGCVHRSQQQQQQQPSNFDPINQQPNGCGTVSGICPYAYSTYPPPPGHHHHHPHQSPSTMDEQFIGQQQQQQHRRQCSGLLASDEAIHHFDRQSQQQNYFQLQNNDAVYIQQNPCCCCTCTGTGSHQTIDYFNSIMQELRFITNRYRREDDLADIISEWKYAAIVIDRLCLIVFSTFAVLSLVICLASAPHLLA
ncbi:neuronal acetylcholine receptor subunit alpha-7-like isoform X3 [Dermatophagoides pteronyssinus]|uniref:neuronal acetylcholine receptor subunit alpha-7-like isoform X3 n=1 Tax=Dermatophagoides pteronyssinus TaxID=6956 RepID=UPI003F67885B